MRLTLSGDFSARRVTYAARRHAARTPVEMAKLAADLTAAGDLLRREAREQVVLMDHRPGAASDRLAPV